MGVVSVRDFSKKVSGNFPILSHALVLQMENVIYSKQIQHPAEDVSRETAHLYLTEEANGFALWLDRQDGHHSLHLLSFFLTRLRNQAIEAAVRAGRLPLSQLMQDAVAKVYPETY